MMKKNKEKLDKKPKNWQNTNTQEVERALKNLDGALVQQWAPAKQYHTAEDCWQNPQGGFQRGGIG